MNDRTRAPASTADREILLTRIFDAPRELVFNAWTDPKQIVQWWGPRGFTTTTYEMDVKPGGVWRFVMHGPDGRDYENRITFDEVVRPEDVARAADSGARFIVTPNVDPEVIAAAHAQGLMILPGAFTPTEVARAHDILDKAWSDGQINAALDQMGIELKSARTALDKTMDEFGGKKKTEDASSSSGTVKWTTLPNGVRIREHDGPRRRSIALPQLRTVGPVISREK